MPSIPSAREAVPNLMIGRDAEHYQSRSGSYVRPLPSCHLAYLLLYYVRHIALVCYALYLCLLRILSFAACFGWLSGRRVLPCQAEVLVNNRSCWSALLFGRLCAGCTTQRG